MKYPTHEVYEKLYLKYINDPENIKFFVDLAGTDLSGKMVMDLCCGTGVVTREALKRNAKQIYMIDKEEDMIPDEFRHDKKRIKVIEMGVAPQLYFFGTDDILFDIIFCRQAVNYWMDDKETVNYLADSMKPGSIFIFNTFNTCPPETPLVKQYEIDGKKFVEISYLAYGKTIHHVQVREGMAPHLTEFSWIPRSWIDLLLFPYFTVERVTVGKTDYYKCTKNKVSLDIKA